MAWYADAMALTYSQSNLLGMNAPNFKLRGVAPGGELVQDFSLDQFSDKKALVVVFMCNHCPYVIAVQDRINELAQEFEPRGVQLIAINPNDTDRYPDDNFENMQKRSREKNYRFPYLIDETQEIAKAYQAVCTPDPYVFAKQGSGFELKYHGRIDDHWQEPSQVKRRDLAEALEAILNDREVSADQQAAMGCSIKWKS